MCKLQLAEAVSAESAQGLVLPEQIQFVVGANRFGCQVGLAGASGAGRFTVLHIHDQHARGQIRILAGRARLASSEPALVTISGPAREPQG